MLIYHADLRVGNIIVEESPSKDLIITKVHTVERHHCSARGTHVNDRQCWTSYIPIMDQSTPIVEREHHAP